MNLCVISTPRRAYSPAAIRRIDFTILIAVSVLAGTHSDLSQVKHVSVKYPA